MKKRLIVLAAVAFVFLFSACGVAGSSTSTNESSAAAQSDPSNGKAKLILENPTVVLQETVDDIKANGGENIGTETDPREITDEGVQFFAAEGENPFLQFASRLNEAEGIQDGNQALYIRFKPSAKDFGFMLSDSGSVGMTIGEDAAPIAFVLDQNYFAPMEGSFQIEPDQWYRALIAMSSGGVLKGMIWPDDSKDDSARFSIAASELQDELYENQSWKALVGFKGKATFTISDYAYYTFTNFAEEN